MASYNSFLNSKYSGGGRFGEMTKANLIMQQN